MSTLAAPASFTANGGLNIAIGGLKSDQAGARSFTADGKLVTTTTIPTSITWANGLPFNDSGELVVVDSAGAVPPTYRANGILIDANGAVVVVAEAGAVLPIHEAQGLKFDANGAILVEGLNFSLNFLSGALDSRVTFSRASNATMFNSLGQLVWAPANLIPQSSTAGAVVGTIGSGGAMPTGWFWSVPPAGITREVLAVDPDYITVRMYGTSSSGALTYPQIIPLATSAASAPGEEYCGSLHVQVVAGDYTGFSAAAGKLNTQWLNGGAYVTETAASAQATTVEARLVAKGRQAAATNAVRIGLNLTLPPLATVDITLKIGKPQLERGLVGTPLSYNRTTGSAYYGPRFDYNPETLAARGLLIEEARTNSIRNNAGVGGVAGTPGTLPTNWSIPSIPGVTVTTAYGVEDGIPYVDITYSGTNTGGASAFPTIAVESASGVAAANGQTWTHSCYVRKVAGADDIAQFNVDLRGRDSSGNLISGQSVTAGAVGGASLRISRTSATFTFTDPLVASVQPRVTRSTLANGASIDITIRLGGSQLERGGFPTSLIPTFGTAATRAGDQVSITGATFSGLYNQAGGTIVVAGTPGADDAASTRRWFDISDGTSANRIQVARNQSATTVHAVLISSVASVSDVNPFSATGLAPFTRTKTAAMFSAAGKRIVRDGGIVGSNAVAVPVSGMTQLVIGGTPGFVGTQCLQGWLESFAYYDTRDFTDPQLQALTS